MTTKSLNIIGDDGAGKKTLGGCLIHKCGLQLPRLEELERSGVSQFREITSFYDNKGYAKSFHGPTGQYVIQNSPVCDVAFWVVDASEPNNWATSAQKLESLLSSDALRPTEKLFILVNKMDLVDWSEQTFKNILEVFNARSITNNRAYILPISSLKGENMLESPEACSWITHASKSQQSQLNVSEQPLLHLL
ncbi:hypothetical protein VHEMI07531 [[Torrubiella] hemipterigena]|uniref:Uncharacterized protein n=1 Tax=[Torrubiella] hemipterigena TaxID=1531966 RepID=A0A0A1TLU7_9HYPO|nr:hypothetical protein VHEMI07531 [[Torrubiella] hemipterigena]